MWSLASFWRFCERAQVYEAALIPGVGGTMMGMTGWRIGQKLGKWVLICKIMRRLRDLWERGGSSGTDLQAMTSRGKGG